jgi:hypothetical protein
MKNNWKTATIFLIIVCLLLIGFNLINGAYSKDYTFTFGEEEISINKNNFNSLTGIMNVGQAQKICDTETGKCVGIIRIEK